MHRVPDAAQKSTAVFTMLCLSTLSIRCLALAASAPSLQTRESGWQEYLRWRRVGPNNDMAMEYLRIDGSTSLEDRRVWLAALPNPNP